MYPITKKKNKVINTKLGILAHQDKMQLQDQIEVLEMIIT